MARLLTSSTGKRRSKYLAITNAILFTLVSFVNAEHEKGYPTNMTIISDTLDDADSAFYTDDSLSRRNGAIAHDSSKELHREYRSTFHESREKRRLHSLPRTLISNSMGFQPSRIDYGSSMPSGAFYPGQLNTFRNAPTMTGASMPSMVGMDAYDNYWGGGGDSNTPDMQVWQGSMGSYGSIQPASSIYPPQTLSSGGGYGLQPNTAGQSPYAGYLEKQISSYPIMIYTLNDCIPCQRAKQLLALHYPDVRAHFLELSGNEPWQQQLQVDLQYLTGAITFPYIFVCGQYIGGQSDLFELHESGQLRRMVTQCLKTAIPKK